MLAPGALLQNRYQIVRLSERNPASSVYEAIDQRFGSTVTVKEWVPGGADASRDAFAREALILNRHFHIALPYVFDTFIEGGVLFIVEQYVPGESLQSVLLRRHPAVNLLHALDWADRLLDLLEYLHHASPPIVNANINPKSIRITPRGDVMLTDFSLCVEGHGRPIGYTLPYAPYEQIQGGEIDALADVYGLAATFYHVLADQAPPNAFERMTGWANGAPVALTPVDQLNAEVPAGVALAIQEALALRREDRTRSAAEFRDALRRGLAPMGAPTEPVSSDSKAPTEVIAPDSLIIDSKAPTAPVSLAEPAETVTVEPEPVQLDPRAMTEPVLVDPKAATVVLDPLVTITDVVTVAPEGRKSRTTVMCRTCGAANDSHRIFCPFCGSLLRRPGEVTVGEKPPEKVCPQCGTENQIDATLCRMCATEFDSGEVELARAAADAPTEALSEPQVPTTSVEPAVEPPRAPLIAQLLVLEGEEPGMVLPVNGFETTFGRAQGNHVFPLDVFMSGQHASVERRGTEYVLKDLHSRNGTFLKIRGETRLGEGDIILAGKQLLRFDPDDRSGIPQIRLLLHSGAVGDSYPVRSDETIIGRTSGDIVFPDDSAMAERHARIVRKGDGVCYVADCGTKNGTFLRVKTEATLLDGDIVIFGKHIFRFEICEWEDDYSTLKSF